MAVTVERGPHEASGELEGVEYEEGTQPSRAPTHLRYTWGLWMGQSRTGEGTWFADLFQPGSCGLDSVCSDPVCLPFTALTPYIPIPNLEWPRPLPLASPKS